MMPPRERRACADSRVPYPLFQARDFSSSPIRGVLSPDSRAEADVEADSRHTTEARRARSARRKPWGASASQSGSASVICACSVPPWWSRWRESDHLLDRDVLHVEGLGDALVRDLAVDHVGAGGDAAVLADRAVPAQARDGARVAER